MATRKAGQMRKNSKNIGKCENYGANVRFAEIEDDSPRNAANATGRRGTFSDENGLDFPDREVLTPKTILGQLNGRTNPGAGKKIMIVLVLLILGLTAWRFAVLTGRIDTGIIRK